jgi:peptidoglycan hydrolase CwlO-like protein
MAQSEGGEMSDTPRMKAAQMAALEHMTGDVWRVGCDLERELNSANQIIRQQQLLDEENLRLQERIKRLEQTLEAVTDKLDNAWGIYMQFKEAKP